MLPRFGFTIYDKPSYGGKSEFMDTNPFTKSLDHALVVPSELINGFYKIRFENERPGDTLFYISENDMKFRGVFTTLILRAILWPIFSIYNVFKK